MKCFIRSTSWVTAGFGQRFAGKNGANFDCKVPRDVPQTLADCTADSEEQKRIFREDPKKYLLYRKNIESELNTRFRFILNGSPEQHAARKV